MIPAHRTAGFGFIATFKGQKEPKGQKGLKFHADFWTNLRQYTTRTIGLAGEAYLPAVKDHAMAEHRPFLFRNQSHQILLHLMSIGLFSESKAMTQAEHVGIDGDAGNIEGIAQDHIGRLSPDPW